jgi:hypothetical protein
MTPAVLLARQEMFLLSKLDISIRRLQEDAFRIEPFPSLRAKPWLEISCPPDLGPSALLSIIFTRLTSERSSSRFIEAA